MPYAPKPPCRAPMCPRIAHRATEGQDSFWRVQKRPARRINPNPRRARTERAVGQRNAATLPRLQRGQSTVRAWLNRAALNSLPSKTFFPRPPFSGSGKIFVNAIAICPLLMLRRFTLAPMIQASLRDFGEGAGEGDGGGVVEEHGHTALCTVVFRDSGIFSPLAYTVVYTAVFLCNSGVNVPRKRQILRDKRRMFAQCMKCQSTVKSNN